MCARACSHTCAHTHAWMWTCEYLFAGSMKQHLAERMQFLSSKKKNFFLSTLKHTVKLRKKMAAKLYLEGFHIYPSTLWTMSQNKIYLYSSFWTASTSSWIVGVGGSNCCFCSLLYTVTKDKDHRLRFHLRPGSKKEGGQNLYGWRIALLWGRSKKVWKGDKCTCALADVAWATWRGAECRVLGPGL